MSYSINGAISGVGHGCNGDVSAQCVADAIRESIVSGTYPENSFLPSQRKLAEELGVRHWTVRLALEKLAVAGIVESCRGRGTRVLEKKKQVAQKTVAFVHPAISAKVTKLETYHIRDGIMQRLRQLEYPCKSFVYYDERISSCYNNDNNHIVTIDELDAVANDYGVFIFLEAEEPVSRFIMNLEQLKVPVVVANLETDLDVSGTCLNHIEISIRAVNTLVSFGHRCIAYLGTRPTVYFYDKALTGYRKGMQAAKLPVDESMISFCDDSTSLYAYQACKKLINRQNIPTAIVAARDVIAAGACHAIEEAGMEVGRDISVIGFDDVSWDGTDQILTTFAEPCMALGSVAVDMLSDLINNGWRPPERRVLDTPLVLRRSVGPPPVRLDKRVIGK